MGWFKKHKLISGLIVIVVFIVLIANNGNKARSVSTTASNSVQDTATTTTLATGSTTAKSSSSTSAPPTSSALASTITTTSVAGSTTAKSSSSTSAPPTSSAPVATTTTTPASTTTTVAATTSNWYDTTYGTFKPVTVSGSSDGVITLPSAATTGIITARYVGSSNFIISALDASNQPTTDLPVDTIGNYSGVTGYGFNNLGNPAAELQITATGSWSVTVSPVSSATASRPASGSGDMVFLYNGPATNWSLTNTGSENFIVSQYSSSIFPNLAVDEIGHYSGEVPMDAGPSVVLIQSDGNWTIS